MGPYAGNQRYLVDAVNSCRIQHVRAAEILFIDDCANLGNQWEGPDTRIYRAPWRLGVSHAYNFGVALAKHNQVILMGSDDLLEPWAVGDCWDTFVASARYDLAYYWMDVKYIGGEEQALPCNAAMVTKALWQHTGGFPIESAIGASDTMLVSIMLKHGERAGRLIRVESKKPPYKYRRHNETDTAVRGPLYQGAIHSVRNVLTERWQPADWKAKPQ